MPSCSYPCFLGRQSLFGQRRKHKAGMKGLCAADTPIRGASLWPSGLPIDRVHPSREVAKPQLGAPKQVAHGKTHQYGRSPTIAKSCHGSRHVGLTPSPHLASDSVAHLPDSIAFLCRRMWTKIPGSVGEPATVSQSAKAP